MSFSAHDWIKILKEALHDNKKGAVIIDFAHEKVHEGDLFLASRYFASILNNSTVTILIVTGNFMVHFTTGIRAGGDAHVEIYEGATADPNGTVLTGFNMSREATNTLNAQLFYTPTVGGGSEGTLIYNSLAPAGKGPQSGGGDLRPGAEMILARNTVYYMVITNVSGNTKNFGVEIEYYEKNEGI